MLTVEDGSGLAGADAFVSVEDADAYLSARGYTLWDTMTSTEKEQAIRRAADHMEQAYADRWLGDRVSTTQALSWPRSGIYGVESDSIPAVVANANAALAFKAASGELSPDVERKVSRETIGPLTTEYEQGAVPWTRFRAIDNMLSALLRPSGTVRLVRS